jgi:hypothetical protein
MTSDEEFGSLSCTFGKVVWRTSPTGAGTTLAFPAAAAIS